MEDVSDLEGRMGKALAVFDRYTVRMLSGLPLGEGVEHAKKYRERLLRLENEKDRYELLTEYFLSFQSIDLNPKKEYAKRKNG